MKKKKVFFRVDGDTKTGLGHLVRCIALANMLKSAFKIVFFCKQIPPQISNELIENQFDLGQIANELNFFESLDSDDIVVLDGYNFDINYQNQIKSIGCKLVCIDDLHDKEFVADLIINHSPGIIPQDYNARSYTKFALGLPYALLRKPFLDQAKVKPVIKREIETLFVCFGGSDFKNLTEQTLIAIKKFLNFKKIIVVTGAAYPNLSTLHRVMLNDDRVVHYHAIDDEKMLTVLKEADLAIVPASGVLFEVLTLNIPIITGSYIDNQAVFITEIIKFKQIFNSIDFSIANLSDSLKRALNAKIECDNLIDGYSGQRINELFKSL